MTLTSTEHAERGAALEVGRQLVGFHEIAERANTTAGTVRSWCVRHADFPEPVAYLATGRVWFWPDVKRWLSRERKPGRPAGAESPLVSQHRA